MDNDKNTRYTVTNKFESQIADAKTGWKVTYINKQKTDIDKNSTNENINKQQEE